MRTHLGSALSVSLVLLLGLSLAGCPKRPASFASAPAAVAPTAPATPSATVPPVSLAPVGPVPAPPPGTFTPTADLEDVHFDFDKSAIRSEDARILDRDAEWLKSNRDLLLIEGHCDERGTVEYNLALGDRRARATMTYLLGQGVSAGRITTISYGKERPLCTTHDESCWARNRRAHFLIKAG